MNIQRVLIGGVAAGIVTNVADFVLHGVIMGPTYVEHTEVFRQTQASPAWFTVLAICTCLVMAFLFGKTRASWAPGPKGGIVFGLLVGLMAFFPQFYNVLVIDGFPYHLSWCWGGIVLIDSALAGAVLGAIIKRE